MSRVLLAVALAVLAGSVTMSDEEKVPLSMKPKVDSDGTVHLPAMSVPYLSASNLDLKDPLVSPAYSPPFWPSFRHRCSSPARAISA